MIEELLKQQLLSQMDLAGIIESKKYSPGKYVTVAIDKMKFVKHVSVGDLVKIYSKIKRIGNTSITIFMKAYVDRMDNNDKIEVTNGLFTYVKIDDNREPITIYKNNNKTTKI